MRSMRWLAQQLGTLQMRQMDRQSCHMHEGMHKGMSNDVVGLSFSQITMRGVSPLCMIKTCDPVPFPDNLAEKEQHMLDQTFVRKSVIARLRRSPLGPHLDHFAASLHHTGYVPSSIQRFLCAAEQFAQWLHEHGYAVYEMDEGLVRAYRSGLTPFNRNQWQPSTGIAGRFRPESVATFDRNTQPSGGILPQLPRACAEPPLPPSPLAPWRRAGRDHEGVMGITRARPLAHGRHPRQRLPVLLRPMPMLAHLEGMPAARSMTRAG